MRHITITLLAITLVAGCAVDTRRQSPAGSQSEFASNFSLPDLLRRMPAPGIQCSGPSFGSGDTGNPGTRRKAFSLDCRITPNSGFDGTVFLSKLQELIAEELRNSGAKIYARGSGGAGFHYDYTVSTVQGGIDIVGRKGFEDKYYLMCVIREVRL